MNISISLNPVGAAAEQLTSASFPPEILHELSCPTLSETKYEQISADPPSLNCGTTFSECGPTTTSPGVVFSFPF